jgi:hypothetical protein
MSPFKEKKVKKKMLPLLELEPVILRFNVVDNSSSLQSRGNALSG